ncbi:unnamed protein product [Clavelina lepadiformis]|uniref:Uncharacterized protein n=1 Tax=Clavelina lepadiformis TaxID=159417 RepID=A0ABP0FG24_CLALP
MRAPERLWSKSSSSWQGDDDAYLCAVTHPGAVDIRVISAHLVGFMRPELNGLVSPANIVDTFIYDDIMNCVFNRPLSVTKIVNGRNVTWDLTSQDFNLLYAEGDVDRRGNVRYHKFRTHTHARFDLSSNFSYPRLDETEAVGELQIHLKKRMSTVALTSGYEATTAELEIERVLAPEGRLEAEDFKMKVFDWPVQTRSHPYKTVIDLVNQLNGDN